MTGVCWMMSRTSSCHSCCGAACCWSSMSRSCCGAACCWSSMSRSCAGAAMSTAAAEAARSRHPRKHTPLRAGTIRPGHSARRSASSSAGLPPRTLMCRETTCRRSRCREGTRPHRAQNPRSEGLQATAKAPCQPRARQTSRANRGLTEADVSDWLAHPRRLCAAGALVRPRQVVRVGHFGKARRRAVVPLRGVRHKHAAAARAMRACVGAAGAVAAPAIAIGVVDTDTSRVTLARALRGRQAAVRGDPILKLAKPVGELRPAEPCGNVRVHAAVAGT